MRPSKRRFQKCLDGGILPTVSTWTIRAAWLHLLLRDLVLAICCQSADKGQERLAVGDLLEQIEWVCHRCSIAILEEARP